MGGSKNEKIVYFVRHGQSSDNVAPVFQATDSPLNEKGRQQANKIADRVAKLPFEALISSPLPRTRQTAEVIAKKTGKYPEYSDLFAERVKPTAIQGKAYTEKLANKMWRDWEKSLYTPNLRIADGENYDDIIKRADMALDFLQNRSEHSMLVVTHGYFLRTIVSRVIAGDLLTADIFRSFQRIASMENTGITLLKYQPAFEEKACWRLWVYNDHAHLAD